MCNYEMEMDLILNGTILKPCDFETEDVVERKGTRKPTDRNIRRKATAKAKARHKRNLLTVYGYESINRGENGKTTAQSNEEWKSSLVATKENGKSSMLSMYKRMDRRGNRQKGKVECRDYDFDMDEFSLEDIYKDEMEKEFFPEKADGTIDIDEYIYWDIDHYDCEDDSDDDCCNWCSCSMIEEAEKDFAFLNKEIAIYNRFISEFNLEYAFKSWRKANE